MFIILRYIMHPEERVKASTSIIDIFYPNRNFTVVLEIYYIFSSIDTSINKLQQDLVMLS